MFKSFALMAFAACVSATSTESTYSGAIGNIKDRDNDDAIIAETTSKYYLTEIANSSFYSILQETYSFTLKAEAWSGKAAESAQIQVCSPNSDNTWFCQLTVVSNPTAAASPKNGDEIAQTMNYYTFALSAKPGTFGASSIYDQMISSATAPKCTMQFNVADTTYTSNCVDPATMYDKNNSMIGANNFSVAYNINSAFASAEDQTTSSTSIKAGFATLSVAGYYTPDGVSGYIS